MSRPLEVLFLVDFSDLDFRTIPFIANLVDSLDVSLTLLHVRAPGEDLIVAEERLTSFFAEADRYPQCERVVASGDVIEAVKRRCATSRVDLLVLPASTPVWLPRPAHWSLRLRLLEATGLPVWTIGSGADTSRLHAPTKNVACWVDLRDERHPHLSWAVAYANSLGAKLHVLTALPELTIPVVLNDRIPLHAETAKERLLEEAGDLLIPPSVHVATENSRRARTKLLQQCNADVVFVAQPEHPLLEWFGARPNWLHQTASATLMIPTEPHAEGWSLQRRRNEVPLRRAG